MATTKPLPPTPVSATPPSLPSPSFTYPYASSPDIIRSHQKDIYQTSILQSQLTSILRQTYGSRFTHTYDSAIHTCTELIYLGLTTLLGNRTLGEEYCDVHQVETRTGRLPSIGRRAGYILSAVLAPYLLGKGMPKIRTRLGRVLEKSLSESKRGTPSHRLQSYILENLGMLTSTAPVYAVSLALFYCSGAYYHLSKRVFRLRYIFSRTVSAGERREGYEVLGVLMVLQMAVQGYLHVQNALATSHESEAQDGQKAQKLALDAPTRIAASTHTPALSEDKARYDLADDSVMAWLQPAQQRKCTLCLEPLKDPSVTTCGHMFCWTCITQWVQERAECPLCRQATLKQHILPLRG